MVNDLIWYDEVNPPLELYLADSKLGIDHSLNALPLFLVRDVVLAYRGPHRRSKIPSNVLAQAYQSIFRDEIGQSSYSFLEQSFRHYAWLEVDDCLLCRRYPLCLADLQQIQDDRSTRLLREQGIELEIRCRCLLPKHGLLSPNPKSGPIGKWTTFF